MLALLPLLLLACTDKDPTDDSGSTPSVVDPALARPDEPPAWSAPGTVDGAAFPWGPQVGDPTADGAILSVRTELDAVVGVVMADDGAGGWVEVARPTLSRDADSLVARVTVDGLAADTVHAWAVYREDPDGAGSRSAVGRFRTATDDAAFRQLTVAATSCLGGNEPIPNMSFAAARAPDLTLLLGDTVYADGAVTVEEYREFWAEAFTWQGLLDTTAGSGVVAAWDDHEVDNNYVVDDLLEGQFDAALQVFRESLPQQEGPTGGVWRQLSWGSILDIFVLEVRAERDEAAGLYIGSAQEAWLLDGLSASTATFKLIVTSVPITDYDDFLGVAAANDRWQGWPEQRSRVLTAIEDAGIEGLLWMGGDVHFATVSSVAIPGTGDPGSDMWEVTVGPAGRSPNVAADLWENDGTHYQFLFSTYNTALLTFDPARLEVGIEFVDDAGATIAETTLAL